MTFKGRRVHAERFDYDVILERTYCRQTTEISLSLAALRPISLLIQPTDAFEMEIKEAVRTITHEPERLADFETRRGAPWAFEAELATNTIRPKD